MAEVNTADVEAKVDAAFGAGFDNTPPAPAEKVVAEPAPESAKPDAVVVPPVIVPEKPQYVRVTKQERDNDKAAIGKIAALESQVAKLTGSAPNAEKIAQQVIDSVRSQTPAGMTVEFSDEDFADLADFPELQKATRSIIEKAFKKANVKGTGPATPPAPPVDVNAAIESALAKRDENTLNRTYPDWSDIVGRPPSADASAPDGNPFRAWLSKQSAEYQKAVNETRSHADIQEAIASFKASSRTDTPLPKPDRAAARRAVIEDAVTPRADGNPPPLNRSESAEEAFAKAFNGGKSH